MFDAQFPSTGGPNGAKTTSGGSSSNMRKASSATNIVDDLSSIFGGTYTFPFLMCMYTCMWEFQIVEAEMIIGLTSFQLECFPLTIFPLLKGPPLSGEFQEVEGETEERRRARLDRHQRTQERAVSLLS